MDQVQSMFPGTALLGGTAPTSADLPSPARGPGATLGSATAAPPGDGISAQWWTNPLGTLTGSTSSSPSSGGFFGVIAGAISSLNDLINSLGTSLQNMLGESNAEGNPSQTVQNASFSSTGDPHLAETGTAVDANGNAYTLNTHFDSMSAHDNLVSSQDFNGGYRVSTSVTTPSANGITMNQSATVHTNTNGDRVTMNNDGSYAITNDGASVQLGLGQSATLDGGETVSRGSDGSLTVSESNANGGSISTTMKAQSGGVDVTGSIQNASVGGDIASGTAGPTPVTPPITNPIASPVGPFGHMLRDSHETLREFTE